MEGLLSFAAFVVAAVIGWAIAEGKQKVFGYNKNDEEKAVEDKLAQQLKQNGYTELGIHDILKTSTFRGFSAV